MTLILTPLQDAITSLEKAVAQPKDEFVRDAVIQRFEYSYELCWKFMKRDMVEDVGDSAINQLSRRDLFRMAADRGLIDEPRSWFDYHEARNQTSHVYNLEIAEKTYEIAVRFSEDARNLLIILQGKHHGSE